MMTISNSAGVLDSDRPLHIAVIGGSLGGLFAALALKSAGFEVDVYERSKGALEARGAGLRIQEDLAQRLLEAGIHVSAGGNALSGQRFRFLGAGNAVLHEERHDVIWGSWKRLYDQLLEALGSDRYHLGANAIGVEQDGKSATVLFADGTRTVVDLVVAADGMASNARLWLNADAVPRYSGYVCWRGLVPETLISAPSRQLLDEVSVYIMPERGHMNIHPIPAQEGDGRDYNVVWYRPVSPQDLNALLLDRAGKQREWSVPAGWVNQSACAELRRAATRDLPPAALEVVLKIDQPFVQVIVDVETARMLDGRFCILGDAAFSGRPHLGAGTAKAGGDAWTLASALSGKSRDTLDAALLKWERERLDIGRRYVETNRELGNALVEGRISPKEFSSRPSWEKILRERQTVW